MANSFEQGAEVLAKPNAQQTQQALHDIYGEMKKWLSEQPKCTDADLPCVELTDGSEVIKDAMKPGISSSKNENAVVKSKGEGEIGEQKTFAPDSNESKAENDQEELAIALFQQTLDDLKGQSPDEAVTASTRLNQLLEEKLSGSGYFATGNSWGNLVLKREQEDKTREACVIARGKVSE